MASELREFVKEALLRGSSREEIRSILKEAGWDLKEADNALGAFAEVAFQVPVPKPKTSLEAREAFLYLVSFITLFISAFSFGALVFQFVNIWIPDPLTTYYADASYGALRSSLAALIVAFPIHLFLMWQIAREVALNPEKRRSGVRRWLSYLTLVVTSSVIIGDLISVLSGLLGGEVTLRFILKALTVLLVAAA
ncbi:MAG: DUF5671 domain-containing protein, partial [Candidatus Pacearchaeota archaeon]|nr:DUF5671 domain-containing protein [Candidatus Pacearchaeota archaeon]